MNVRKCPTFGRVTGIGSGGARPGVQGHEDSAVPRVAGGVDEARYLLSAQYDGDLPSEDLGKRQIVAREPPLQDLVEQERSNDGLPRVRPGVELPLLQIPRLGRAGGARNVQRSHRGIGPRAWTGATPRTSTSKTVAWKALACSVLRC